MDWIFGIFILIAVIDRLRTLDVQLGPLKLNLGFAKSRLLKTEATLDEQKRLED